MSVTYLSEIGFAGTTVTDLQGSGNIFVYQTLDGFRGKMEALAYNQGAGPSPDIFNFNYITYLGGPTASGSSSVEDCTSGPNCYLDMNLNSTSGSASSANVDLWFTSNGLGDFILMPQGTARFYKMP
jgi:hypothetical protein